jgi:GNAT superfamily N-acetyltransferase
MQALNREERKTLRLIQTHIRESTRAKHAVIEPLGTVDVHFHPSNLDPYLNCATPHKGVAWVRRDDLYSAFTGLERLGRVPRFVFQDALFPRAFEQQLELMGLTLEEQRVIMVFRPIYGPNLLGETPRGRLPTEFNLGITASVATSQADLAAWLRVFKAGYYNTETLSVNPLDVEPLVQAAERGDKMFVLASYQDTPLGTAQISLRGASAEIETLVTAPLWHGMGLETALITTAVRATLERSCNIIFTVAATDPITRLYRVLGFVDLTHVMTFWQAEEHSHSAPEDESENTGDDRAAGRAQTGTEDISKATPEGAN